MRFRRPLVFVDEAADDVAAEGLSVGAARDGAGWLLALAFDFAASAASEAVIYRPFAQISLGWRSIAREAAGRRSLKGPITRSPRLTSDDAVHGASRPVALRFLYRLVRRVVELVGIHGMDAVAKDAEIQALRV